MTQDHSRVPGREHYCLAYLRDGRLFSYAHQLDSVLSLEPASVVEVGPGGGMVTSLLRSLDIAVKTVDVELSLRPDVVASVTDLPFSDDQFDVALCCQVLEHLPFGSLGPALGELNRVARKGIVVSVPDVTLWMGIALSRPPRYGPRVKTMTFPSLRTGRMPPERLHTAGHHWEIGYKGYELPAVLATIRQAHLNVLRTWRVFEKPWHRFFVLSGKDTAC